ncbi:hypothetical protein D3C72_1303270 [compost metagenome]
MLALQAHRDGEVGHGVHEVGGAVDRVDDPGVRLVGAFDQTAFLAEEAVAGARLHQQFVEGVFGLQVGGRDEIAGPFARNLKLGDFAEIAKHGACGLAHGSDDDLNESRGEGHGVLLVRLSLKALSARRDGEAKGARTIRAPVDTS